MKLDIFHAVKRISDKIPKIHPLRNDCVKDLSISSQSDDEEFIIPLHALKLILLKALSWYFVHEHMSKQTQQNTIEIFAIHL